jgi:hypothetical protein
VRPTRHEQEYRNERDTRHNPRAESVEITPREPRPAREQQRPLRALKMTIVTSVIHRVLIKSNYKHNVSHVLHVNHVQCVSVLHVVKMP